MNPNLIFFNFKDQQLDLIIEISVQNLSPQEPIMSGKGNGQTRILLFYLK